MSNGVHVAVSDCSEMRDRHRDGATFSGLSEAFSVTYETVRMHVRGECCHAGGADPVPYEGGGQA